MGNRSGRITFLASLITTSALYVGVAAAVAPSVDVGSASPDASNKAVVTVSLTSNGGSVGGLQNTIVFDNTILTLTTANCTINPAIGLSPGGADCTSDTTVGPCKNLSKAIHQCGASPEPQGCPAGAGANLSALTAIIAATAAPNTNAIPDGALYTCTFTVANAAGLPATLTNSGIVTSDPTGHQLCSSSGATPCGGANGTISSGGGTPAPTNTPAEATNTPAEVATNTPAPTPSGPSVDVGDATPDASNKAAVTVSLSNNGANVGGMQNTIVFDNTILTLTTANCTINPAIGLNPGGADCTSDTTVGPCKNLSKAIHQCGASPEPQGCPAGAGANLSALTAIIAATAAPNTNSIPDGALYTCTFTVSGTLPSAGTMLQNLSIVTSDPTGHQLCSSSGATPCAGTNGLIASVLVPTNTPGGGTPVPTNTPPVGPSNTPVTPVGPTNTPVVPTATHAAATNTPAATATAAPTTTTFTAFTGQAAAAGSTTLVLASVPSGFPTSGTITLIGNTPVNIPYTLNGNTMTLGSPLPMAVPAETAITVIAGGGGVNAQDSDGCQIGTVGGGSAWLLLIPAVGLLVMRRRRH